MLERYADIPAIREAASGAAAEWQSLAAALDSSRGADPKAVARLGSGLLQARISATGLLLCELGKALEARVHREALKPALRIVTFELDRLGRGEIGPSLYMAPVAQELASAAEALARPWGAFFLPVVPILPPVGQVSCAPEDFAQAVETHRLAYENALIRFARQGDREALAAMQAALIAIENRNPAGEFRVVIALASAFISALEDGVLPLCDEGRHLFSRIDAVLRAAVRHGRSPDLGVIASRLAHVLVRAPATHKRSALLQERLGLKSLLSHEAPALADFPAPDIFDTVFQSVVDQFERYLGGDDNGQGTLKAMDRLRLVCGVNVDALRMAGALQNLMAGMAAGRIARSPEMEDHLAQFMARMLDAVSSRNPRELEKVSREEVEAAANILREGGLSMVIRDATSLSMADFFREAAVDARGAHALIDGAGEEPDSQVVARTTGLLEMVEAVLTICYQEEGARLVARIREAIGQQRGAGFYAPALDVLARYLDAVGSDPQGAQGLLQEIRERHLEPKTRAASEDLPNDQEVFDIFLEEAREVVGAIREAVGQGSRVLEDREVATAVRRGFHTLKGSARMSGLMHLGEAMFAAEKVFNTWLTHPLPYPPELSAFAERWSGFALATCETIARQGRCDVDAGALAEDGGRLLAMAEAALPPSAAVEKAEVPGPAAPAVPVAPVEAPAAATEEFDPDLLALYFVESAEMLAKLRELARAARGGFIAFEMIRAAHGLAGMSRTVGLPEIASMALPVEHWAAHLHELRHRPADADIDRVLAAADEIEACIQSIKAGRRREPDLSLVAGLRVPLEEPEDSAPAAAPAPEEAPPAAAQAPAAVPAAVPAAPPPAQQEEIDSLVLREFAEEATDLLQALDDELVSPSPSIPQINRFLHTFKGGARLCGAMALGDLLHRLENVTSRSLSPDETKAVLAEVDQGLDEARMMLSVLLTPEGGEEAAAVPAADAASPPAEGLQIPLVESDENVVFKVTSGQISELTGQLDDMRVARDMLAQQLRDAEEAAENIFHPARRIEEIAAQIQIEAETRMDTGASSAQGHFDALELDRFTTFHELTRKLTEAVHDILAVSESLSGSLTRADRALLQSRSAAEVFATRLAGISRGPLDVLEARLKAAVRSAAVTLGKDCQVELPPSKVRIERAVLDRVAPALDHLVRNSVAHGVESPDKRRAAGKAATGTITISARQKGEMAEIVVADDGGGINVEAVRRKIRERGLESRYPNEENLLDALFDPGFSTAETLTQVAGRGVGLDVVQDIVSHLGGKVRIDNRPGQGVSFVLTVPVSASFVSGLMLTMGQGVYLLPGASVVELVVLSGDVVRRALETGEPALVNGRPVHITWLGSLVDAGSRPAINNYNKIVLVDGGRTGLFADDVQYMDSLLTKPFAQAAAWGGSILGCAILHDGRTALIIDPARTLALMPRDTRIPDLAGEEEAKEPLVLVVDDSITVRKVTSKLLLRHGYRVETAENGKVALDRLQDMGKALPVAILMDIEMPVMDGFEATQRIKAGPLTAAIPVIIISSRNVDKHIDYAKSMGADHFLGKPYREDELLGLLGEYKATGVVPVAA